jgi:hypothetical protein
MVAGMQESLDAARFVCAVVSALAGESPVPAAFPRGDALSVQRSAQVEVVTAFAPWSLVDRRRCSLRWSGLNPVSSGDACVQTVASKQGSTVHLFNIDGLVPTWNEVCGRSAISGSDNSGSMAGFGAFNANQRLLDRDPCWLNTNMSAACSADSTTVRCTMTANNQ